MKRSLNNPLDNSGTGKPVKIQTPLNDPSLSNKPKLIPDLKPLLKDVK